MGQSRESTLQAGGKVWSRLRQRHGAEPGKYSASRGKGLESTSAKTWGRAGKVLCKQGERFGVDFGKDIGKSRESTLQAGGKVWSRLRQRHREEPGKYSASRGKGLESTSAKTSG